MKKISEGQWRRYSSETYRNDIALEYSDLTDCHCEQLKQFIKENVVDSVTIPNHVREQAEKLVGLTDKELEHMNNG